MIDTEHAPGPVGLGASRRPHSFHIPVMGTGFTIDTPLRVAKYGISSVVSLVDDILIEQMRKFHCEKIGEPYEPITDRDEDPRANRITAYLNLLQQIVQRQSKALQASPFEPGSDITRYYQLLPHSPLKQAYDDMLATDDPAEKAKMQDELRSRALPSAIDVNIMTTLDRDSWRNGEKLPAMYSDAMSALRGFARSTVQGSVIMSAGMNRRLYNYMAEFDEFLPGEADPFSKQIILKVSDYRSAMIQGRCLAKVGLWVSEYRIESGANCGGHAFPAKGQLMGPILEEFRAERENLTDSLYQIYSKALAKMGRHIPRQSGIRITVQCGISTAAENDLLLRKYGVDGTGWGTPFLLVPEVANVDEDTLAKLADATDDDVYLSSISPLQVPFWVLRNCGGEEDRLQRVADGAPGAICGKKYARSNTEFTDTPICIASRTYIEKKLAHLASEGLSDEQMSFMRESVLNRACACHELGGSVTKMHDIHPIANSLICPGPNIADFSKTSTLEEMIDHIYGRVNIMTRTDAPHLFVREARIYIEYLLRELHQFSLGLSTRTQQYFAEFKENLNSGTEYYVRLFEQHTEELPKRFLQHFQDLRDKLHRIVLPAESVPV
jgi:hypothetical protein